MTNQIKFIAVVKKYQFVTVNYFSLLSGLALTNEI